MSAGPRRRSPFDVEGLLAEAELASSREGSTNGRTGVSFSEESTEDSSLRAARVMTDAPAPAVARDAALAGTRIRGASVFDWTRPQEASADTSPERLEGRYVGPVMVEDRIGSGAHAHVYRATMTATGRKCALKVPRERYRVDLNLRRRFHAEGRALLSLRHPNVIEHYAMGELEDGRPYLVLELVRGETLSKLIARERRFSEERVRSLAAQIAAGLAALHEAGLVHRDLKPGNIGVSGEPGHESLKLLDLGLVRFLDPGELTRLTVGDGLIGTPAYMAPEQILSPATVGPAADLYALGVVLFELLEGRRPFEGTKEAVLNGHLERQPAFQVNSGELQRLTARLLEKDPERRPTSARAVLAALTGPEGRFPPRWERPRGRELILLAGLFVAGFLGARAYELRYSEPPTPETPTPIAPVLVRTTSPGAESKTEASTADALNVPSEPTEADDPPPTRSKGMSSRSRRASRSPVREAEPSPTTHEAGPGTGDEAEAGSPSSRASLELRGRRTLGLLQLLTDRSPELVDELEARYLSLKRELEKDDADLSRIEAGFEAIDRAARQALDGRR